MLNIENNLSNDDKNKKRSSFKYFALTHRLVLSNKEDYKNKKSYNQIKNNFEKACEKPDDIRKYRNNIAHLSIIRNIDSLILDKAGNGIEIRFNSYFELYHYLMQKKLEILTTFTNKNGKEVKSNQYTKNTVKNLFKVISIILSIFIQQFQQSHHLHIF